MPAVAGSLHAARVHKFAALLSGSDTSPMHGDCLRPVFIEYRGVASDLLYRLRDWDSPRVDYADGYGLIGEWSARTTDTAYISVRCRKCEPCLKQRAKVWASRASVEVRSASRSWFGTLTYRPSERFRVRCIADAYNASRGVRWDDLNTDEQFREQARVARRHFQLFLKRVRKATRARIRYCMTTEAHADGFPHLHLLLHEYEGRAVKRLLEQQWTHGLSHWRLVDADDHKVPWYICKYLTKSILARPVASLRYGQPPMEALTERLHLVAGAVTRARGKAGTETNRRQREIVISEGPQAT